MSVEQNKAAVRGFVEAFNRGDLDGCLPFLAEGVAVYFPGMPGPLGVDGYRELGAAFLAGFPDLRIEIVEMIAEGDRVATRELFAGTHSGPFQGMPATGRAVRLEAIYTDRLVGGKIVERHTVIDTMGLMQQLGAIPAPEQAAGPAA